ncbi:MAG: V-type ATP synthase subunit K [Christensenellaceae bacterium]|nr:V-type ATP synthase subunit K [Christensenellaceae bacterium]
MELGQVLALLGAGIAVIGAGCGSSIGVGSSGETASAVSSENPEVASKLLVLQLLPATQGIYGFLIAVIVLIKTNIMGGAMASVSVMQGLLFIAGCLPIGIVGLISAIYQGKVASAAMIMTGEHPEMSGRGITMTVMVETYAVLALLTSFLIVNSIQL